MSLRMVVCVCHCVAGIERDLAQAGVTATLVIKPQNAVASPFSVL